MEIRLALKRVDLAYSMCISLICQYAHIPWGGAWGPQMSEESLGSTGDTDGWEPPLDAESQTCALGRAESAFKHWAIFPNSRVIIFLSFNFLQKLGNKTPVSAWLITTILSQVVLTLPPLSLVSGDRTVSLMEHGFCWFQSTEFHNWQQCF